MLEVQFFRPFRIKDEIKIEYTRLQILNEVTWAARYQCNLTLVSLHPFG